MRKASGCQTPLQFAEVGIFLLAFLARDSMEQS